MKKSAPQYKKIVKESLVPLAKIQTKFSAATTEVEKVEREVSEQLKLLKAQLSSHLSNFMKSYTSGRSNCWTERLN